MTIDETRSAWLAALLDAVPGPACLVDGTGRSIARNDRWNRDLAVLSTPVIAHAIAAVVEGGSAEVEVELPLVPGHRLAVRALPGQLGGAIVTVVESGSPVAGVPMRDAVTGLPNRMLILDRLRQLLTAPGQGNVGVLYVDLDRFGLVNSTFGTDVGDRVLALVARRLESHLGAGSSTGRVGDDQFVVLLEPLGSGDAVARAADELRRVLAEPHLIDGVEVVTTASIGVTISAAGLSIAAELLRDTQLASRQARDQGGDRVVVAEQGLHEASAYRMEVEGALRRSLERDELHLVFQPEVSLESGLVVGAEALLRWDHPTLGKLSPLEFIHIAEETGLIVPIGRWVLESACRQAAGWTLPEEDHRELYVAVNVSAHQLADPDLAVLVAQTLSDTGLPARRLCLEVTETVVLQQLDVARTTLATIRDLGVRIALDDFGTGYASFDYLMRLPLDIVKLDASFIARLATDPQDRAIVESMVALSRRLGLQVVAEGVEDEAQRAVLVTLGCDIVQGYDLGRPGDERSLLDVVWGRANAAE